MKTNKDIIKVIEELKMKPEEVDTELGKVVAFEAHIELKSTSDPRKQSVIARIYKHEQFGEVVELVSVIGELEKYKKDPEKALEILLALLMLNQRLITAKTQVDQQGKQMYIVARTLAPSCTKEELGTMIQEVAIYADHLENELFGVDKS